MLGCEKGRVSIAAMQSIALGRLVAAGAGAGGKQFISWRRVGFMRVLVVWGRGARMRRSRGRREWRREEYDERAMRRGAGERERSVVGGDVTVFFFLFLLSPVRCEDAVQVHTNEDSNI